MAGEEQMSSTLLVLGGSAPHHEVLSRALDGLRVVPCSDFQELCRGVANEKALGVLINGDLPTVLSLCAEIKRDRSTRDLPLAVFHSNPIRPRLVEHAFSPVAADRYLAVPEDDADADAIADWLGWERVLPEATEALLQAL